MSKTIVGAVVVIVILIGGIALFTNQSQTKNPQEFSESNQNATKTLPSVATNAEVTEKGTPAYQGKVLAGDSPYIFDFVKSDFDKALKEDWLIVLYFYANWCPICRAEFPLMQQAFDELSKNMENGSRVVAFRVNFNDSDTDKDEENLAREHGVAYQHTKVFIKNGQRILKSPEGWDKQRYLDEIGKVL